MQYVDDSSYLCPMEKKKKRILILCMAALLLAAGIAAGTVGYLWFAPQFFPPHTVHIYVDADDTADSVYNQIERKSQCSPIVMESLKRMGHYRHYKAPLRTGHYTIRRDESIYHVLSRLLRGYQEPVNLVIGSVRQVDKLARNVGRQLMVDSADVASLLADSVRLAALGYDRQTLPALFIPNTYEVYWNMSAEAFLQRMAEEHERFWNASRRDKAKTLGMTPTEVATLASIVEEETNNSEEKPVVAGLYINRLRRGIPLQADPTVRFAVGDFERQRVTHADLSIDSPYNTYLHTGLPPGPIRIATPEGLDAVLNFAQHNYLYMCAKEDFSGRHNFASNYAEHLRNARRYQQALNKRKIFR